MESNLKSVQARGVERPPRGAEVAARERLPVELADVLFVVLCLANQTGVNLQEAFDKKLDLKTSRDHDRHHNNQKLK